MKKKDIYGYLIGIGAAELVGLVAGLPKTAARR